MSSLRVETLRLCWLEAFIKVADEENISSAARELGVDQSTVSRYLQSLEKWLGKTFVVSGEVWDPQDTRISVGITEEGQKFRDVAERIIDELQGFRSPEARRDELTAAMAAMILKMQNGLAVSQSISTNLERFQDWLDACRGELPIEMVKILHDQMRLFFSEYEVRANKERRGKRKGGKTISGRDIDMSILAGWEPEPLNPIALKAAVRNFSSTDRQQ